MQRNAQDIVGKSTNLHSHTSAPPGSERARVRQGSATVNTFGSRHQEHCEVFREPFSRPRAHSAGTVCMRSGRRKRCAKTTVIQAPLKHSSNSVTVLQARYAHSMTVAPWKLLGCIAIISAIIGPSSSGAGHDDGGWVVFCHVSFPAQSTPVQAARLCRLSSSGQAISDWTRINPTSTVYPR
jgi:hypothetical protein